MRYPLVLEGWHNCVNVFKHRVHCILTGNLNVCLIFCAVGFFFSAQIIILTETGARIHFSCCRKECWMAWGVRDFVLFCFFCTTNWKKRKLWVSAAAQSLRGLLFLPQRPLLYGQDTAKVINFSTKKFSFFIRKDKRWWSLANYILIIIFD